MSITATTGSYSCNLISNIALEFTQNLNKVTHRRQYETKPCFVKSRFMELCKLKITDVRALTQNGKNKVKEKKKEVQVLLSNAVEMKHYILDVFMVWFQFFNFRYMPRVPTLGCQGPLPCLLWITWISFVQSIRSFKISIHFVLPAL